MKNSYYFRKAGYLKENADNFTSFRNLLLLTFYLFAVLTIAIIFGLGKQKIYIKIIYALLILLYPFYIFELELILYKTYLYIYSLVLAEPHISSKI
jgi:hypothetical protein|tara:strand:+ start:198 stop:485 length:288 start_codon:yes stop_codon:yes gene_type:complete